MSLLVFAATLVACTTAPATPTPAAKEPAAAKPAASPSPLAASSPAPAAKPQAPVGGGAAQPRAAATFAPIGGSAALIVPTPNFASQATAVPAALAPTVAIGTVQPAGVVQVTGTLSRIPTAVPGPAGASAANAIATAQAGGANVNLVTIGAILTSTPLVRIQQQPQPTIAFPPR
ncbi:MAG: hypothetical protein IT306_00345 [Chloroflexi bacterium]|nr:hypothetical protein [Chloroflexota bacterium]